MPVLLNTLDANGSTPFPVQAIWCILLFSRTVNRHVQESFVSLCHAVSAMFEVVGMNVQLDRLRFLCQRGNNANKIFDADFHS